MATDCERCRGRNPALIITSTNGLRWQVASSGTWDPLWSVAFGAGRFVAVGQNGLILSSPNGIVWQTADSGTTNTLSAVAYGDSLFVAAGDRGTLLTSTDGVAWTPQISTATNNLSGIGFGDHTFVVVGDNGVIATSNDATQWTTRASGIHSQLLGVAYGQNRFVAVGPSGTILQSDSLVGPQLGLVSPQGSNPQLILNGQANANYLVQRSSDLLRQTDVGTLIMTNDTALWPDLSSGSSNVLFYRTIVQ